MSPELIGGLVLALTGLLTGISGILTKRAREQREELEQMRSDFRHIRQQLRYADMWIYRMTRAMDQNGVPVPPAPDGLIISPSSGVSSDNDD